MYVASCNPVPCLHRCCINSITGLVHPDALLRAKSRRRVNNDLNLSRQFCLSFPLFSRVWVVHQFVFVIHFMDSRDSACNRLGIIICVLLPTMSHTRIDNVDIRRCWSLPFCPPARASLDNICIALKSGERGKYIYAYWSLPPPPPLLCPLPLPAPPTPPQNCRCRHRHRHHPPLPLHIPCPPPHHRCRCLFPQCPLPP